MNPSLSCWVVRSRNDAETRMCQMGRLLCKRWTESERMGKLNSSLVERTFLLSTAWAGRTVCFLNCCFPTSISTRLQISSQEHSLGNLLFYWHSKPAADSTHLRNKQDIRHQTRFRTKRDISVNWSKRPIRKTTTQHHFSPIFNDICCVVLCKK